MNIANARKLKFNSQAEFDNYWIGDDFARLHADGWRIQDIIVEQVEPGRSPDGTNVVLLLLPPVKPTDTGDASSGQVKLELTNPIVIVLLVFAGVIAAGLSSC